MACHPAPVTDAEEQPAHGLPAPIVRDPLGPADFHDLRRALSSVDDLGESSDSLAVAVDVLRPSLREVARRTFLPGSSAVLAALQLPPGRALVLGVGGGTTAHHLAERGSTVLGLESDRLLAALARSRCADVPQVTVEAVADRYADLPPGPFDLVVVSAADDVAASRGELVESLAERCAHLLAPHGLLVMGMDNSRATRFVVDLDDQPSPDSRTLAQVRALGEVTGLATRVLGCFPEHRLCRSLVDLDALSDQQGPRPSPTVLGSLPGAAAIATGKADPIDAALLRTTWLSALTDDVGQELVGSFVVLLSRQPPRAAYTDLATTMSQDRRSSQASITRLTTREGRAVMVRERRFPDVADDALVVRFTPSVEPVVEGDGLVDLLAAAPSLPHALDLLGAWVDLVVANTPDETGSRQSWDLIPRNIIVADTGLHAVDQEWSCPDGDAASVLRRGCFWLAEDLLQHPLAAAWLPGGTIGQVAGFLAAAVGVDLDLADFAVVEGEQVASIWLSHDPASDARRAALAVESRSHDTPLRPPLEVAGPVDLETSPHETETLHRLTKLTERLVAGRRALQHDHDAAMAAAAVERQQRARDLAKERLEHRDHVIGLTVEAEALRDRAAALQAENRRLERTVELKDQRLSKKNRQIVVLRKRLVESDRRVQTLHQRPGTRFRRVLGRLARRVRGR